MRDFEFDQTVSWTISKVHLSVAVVSNAHVYYNVVRLLLSKGELMGTLTIRIDEQLERDLEQLAQATHRSKSELAREILRRRLAVEKYRELRRRAIPFAEAAGYLTDDDIFRDIS